MTKFKSGFHALAYPASNLSSSDSPSPCQCSLVFKYDDARKQATVLLVATIATTAPRSSHDEHTFVLQYDADKLLPAATHLNNGNPWLSSLPLTGLARDENDPDPKLKTLALSFKQPCPLWCPDFPSFAHKPGSEFLFRQFVALTTAATVHIVFDFKHLHKNAQGLFKLFGKAAENLAGYPVRGLLTGRQLKQATWEVFGPVDGAGAPPAYDGPSRKRPRQSKSGVSTVRAEQLTRADTRSASPDLARSSTEPAATDKTSPQSTSSSPPTKRLATGGSQSSTERATSDDESLSRRRSKGGHTFKDQAEAISATVRKEQPAFDYHVQVIDSAVRQQLPIYVKEALPALLETLVPEILPTLFTSTPPDDSDLDSPNTYQPLKLTPLGMSLMPHIGRHMRDQLQQLLNYQLKQHEELLDRLWDQAEDQRQHETAELLDDMEEHKAELQLLKKDAVDDLSRELTDALEKAREEGREWNDVLGDKFSDAFSVLCDRIEGLKQLRVKKMVAVEMRKYERRRKRVRRPGRNSAARGEKKLLGRKREASSWL